MRLPAKTATRGIPDPRMDANLLQAEEPSGRSLTVRQACLTKHVSPTSSAELRKAPG